MSGGEEKGSEWAKMMVFSCHKTANLHGKLAFLSKSWYNVVCADVASLGDASKQLMLFTSPSA